MEDTHPVIRIKPLGFQWETADPFLFCVHHEDFYPKGNEYMEPDASLEGRNIGSDFIVKDGWRMYHGSSIPGFPGHPHRGFETITVVRDGIVDHADSLGASGRYGDGDVQWMTAGKGVQHSEMFPLINQDKDNRMELFQIWINLPRAQKMVEPHFKMIWGDTIPKYEATDTNGNKSHIAVISGTLEGHTAPAPPPESWAADKSNRVGIYTIKMAPKAEWTLPKAPEGINRTIYFFTGEELLVADRPLPFYHAAEVRVNKDIKLLNGNKESEILILQGKPIAEPVVQHGPFVMNTKEEIQQAFSDYQRTQFGGWPWPKTDQVHDRNKGRFARHADGREEKRG
ncbi:MAG: pirin [Flavobacteriales bacterium]|nr:MAG: pirin [Flavobacteriales bacterium]